MAPTGSTWIDIKEQSPPHNGQPVLVCLAKPIGGSHQHVATFTMNGAGELTERVAGRSSFDGPPVLCWKHLGQLPWYEGWPLPETMVVPM